MVNNLFTYRIDEIYDIIKTGKTWSMDIQIDTLKVQCQSDHNIQNELKKRLLPYACINGVFQERKDSSLLEYSSYTAIDFDKFQSEEEMETVKGWLKETPFVKFFYVSPSGRGLKAIIEHTNTEPKKHKALYEELLQYFRIPQVDPKTSDLSRATYLCYDPQAWWNPNCIPYQFDESKYSEDIVLQRTTSSSSAAAIALPTDYNKKVDYFNSFERPKETKITDASIKRIVYSWINKDTMTTGRNNALYQYSCTLCKAGIKYKTALYWLNEKFSELGLHENEIQKTTCSAYSRCINEFGTERDSKFM